MEREKHLTNEKRNEYRELYSRLGLTGSTIIDRDIRDGIDISYHSQYGNPITFASIKFIMQGNIEFCVKQNAITFYIVCEQSEKKTLEEMLAYTIGLSEKEIITHKDSVNNAIKILKYYIARKSNIGATIHQVSEGTFGILTS